MYCGRLAVVSDDSLRAEMRLRWVRRGLEVDVEADITEGGDELIAGGRALMRNRPGGTVDRVRDG